jgi:hypothetical protein
MPKRGLCFRDAEFFWSVGNAPESTIRDALIRKVTV